MTQNQDKMLIFTSLEAVLMEMEMFINSTQVPQNTKQNIIFSCIANMI